VLGDEVDEAGVVHGGDAVDQPACHAARFDIGLQGIDLSCFIASAMPDAAAAAWVAA